MDLSNNIAVEVSVDEKGSFDTEFSLLESTLIELKDDLVTENKNASRLIGLSDEIFREPPEQIILCQNELSRPNDTIKSISVNSVNSEHAVKSSNEKYLKDIYFHDKNSNNSQYSKSINVPSVSKCSSEHAHNLNVSTVNLCSNFDLSPLPSSSEPNGKSNDFLLKNDCEVPVLKSISFNEKQILPDKVISICDSSVEVYKNRQFLTKNSTYLNIESENSEEMDIVNDIENVDNIILNKSFDNKCEPFDIIAIECSTLHGSSPDHQPSDDHNTGREGLDQPSYPHNAGREHCDKPDNDHNSGQEDHDQPVDYHNAGQEVYNQSSDHNADREDLDQSSDDPNAGQEDHDQPADDHNAGQEDLDQPSNDRNVGEEDYDPMSKNGIGNITPPIGTIFANCNKSISVGLENNLQFSATDLDKLGNKTHINLIPQKQENLQKVSLNYNLSYGINSDLTINCKEVRSSHTTPKKYKENSAKLCSFESISQNATTIDGNEMQTMKCLDNLEPKDHLNIFCSTPIISGSSGTNYKRTPESCAVASDFQKLSSLDVSCKKNKTNLKRKFSVLKCIEEVNEEVVDSSEEKKIKYENEDTISFSTKTRNEEDMTTSLTHFETPAKSVLKKWKTSNFSRGAGFYIIDECGESDDESTKSKQDTNKTNNKDVIDSSKNDTNVVDDFEIACNSLNEEIMKGSNIEALEKYYSYVQHESQIDGEQFDEVLQELTLNYDLGDQNLPSQLLPLEECLAAKEDDISTSVKAIYVTEEGKTEVLKSEQLRLISDTNENVTVCTAGNENNCKMNNDLQKTEVLAKCIHGDDLKSSDRLKENNTLTTSEETKSDDVVSSNSSTLGSVQSSKVDTNKTIVSTEEEDMAVDEEEILLAEDITSKAKPYEFREFVSSDPKENEDNYNPEWKKLGQLTNDEERYKAVRDRWRSLVPPDPNKDLTCRQWRERNKKPPINICSRNNNYPKHANNEKKQCCTAVFDIKIKKFVQELDDSRRQILANRHMDFEKLATIQDRQQANLARRGGSLIELSILHNQHIEECRKLKSRHDLEFAKITRITESKINILKDASTEVFLFQKFYKGYGGRDDDCLCMTDIQVQELMETEEMLERYTDFYSN